MREKQLMAGAASGPRHQAFVQKHVFSYNKYLVHRACIQVISRGCYDDKILESLPIEIRCVTLICQSDESPDVINTVEVEIG